MKTIVPIIKNTAIFFCAIFTAATLANSIGVLWLGQGTNPDVHGHIMLRAVVCLIITITLTFAYYAIFKIKNFSLSRYAITSGIVLILIFACIWAFSSGNLWISADEIHPDAFGDLSRSILIPAVVMTIIGFFVLKRKNRR